MNTGSNQASKIIAISDLHFGDRTQLLDDRALVDRLVETLSGRGAVGELVLLGDLLDLWVKTLVPALSSARYFIRGLAQLPNVERITYVPGNHDHQVFMEAYWAALNDQVRSGNLATPRFVPSRSYPDSVICGLVSDESGARFPLEYPFLVREANGRKIIFTHGHHLDFYDRSFSGWFRTFWLSRHIIRKRRKGASLRDIEMANVPFYSGMSAMPWVPELVEEGLRFYNVINFFAKIFRAGSLLESPRRDTLIKDNYDEIEMLLPMLGHPDASTFVFGHTHRPGVGKIPGSGVTVANAGSWVRQESKDVPSMTWIEAEHDVKLYRLADGGEELMYSESI